MLWRFLKGEVGEEGGMEAEFGSQFFFGTVRLV